MLVAVRFGLPDLANKNTVPLLSNLVLEVLARVISQQKTTGILIMKKKAKFSRFPDDMILYIENPKDS